jgi:hypothetical protein
MWRAMSVTKAAVDPVSAGMLFAWVLVGIAAVTGTTMVVVGLIEELPGLIRTTLQHMSKR